MTKSMLWLVTLLCTATLAVAQQTPPQPVTPPSRGDAANCGVRQ